MRKEPEVRKALPTVNRNAVVAMRDYETPACIGLCCFAPLP